MAWIKPVENDEHYKFLIKEIDKLVDLIKRTTFEEYILEVYMELVGEYEDKMEEGWFSEKLI
jgi:antitoxin component HigA of HigAB toxin-antitoxin module